MTSLREAQLDGMMAATSTNAFRQVPPQYDVPELRDAWLREFDVMQQTLGTWSPAVRLEEAKPAKPKRQRVKKAVKADPEPPPPANRSMLAILEDSIV